MDLLIAATSETSFLKQFWSVQTLAVGGALAFNVLTGSYTEKTANQKDIDEKLGIFQFRRK